MQHNLVYQRIFLFLRIFSSETTRSWVPVYSLLIYSNPRPTYCLVCPSLVSEVYGVLYNSIIHSGPERKPITVQDINKLFCFGNFLNHSTITQNSKRCFPRLTRDFCQIMYGFGVQFYRPTGIIHFHCIFEVCACWKKYVTVDRFCGFKSYTTYPVWSLCLCLLFKIYTLSIPSSCVPNSKG